MENFHQYEGNFACKICDEKFQTKMLHDRHVQFYHIQNVDGYKGDFTCEKCGKMFVKKVLLERHVTMVHDITPEVCDICGRKFRWKHGLKNHRKTHEGIIRAFMLSIKPLNI